MAKKTASSQAAWALLTEGVARSRVETHRIQLLVERVMKLVEASDHKEHIYQVAGDAIEAMPKRIDALELALDRTSLALSKMGTEFYDSRLPLSDKVMVDEAIEAAFGGAQSKHSVQARRVAERYLSVGPIDSRGKPLKVGDWIWDSKLQGKFQIAKLDSDTQMAWLRPEGDNTVHQDRRPYIIPWKQRNYWTKRADLNPPLGKPGGPCQVVKRIDMTVVNPSVKENLIDEIEHGDTFTNSDASQVYGPEIEFLGGIFRKMYLSAHAQYRMDLRGITVALVQRSLMDLSTAMGKDQYMMRDVFQAAGRGYRWEDHKRGITIVIDPQGRDTVRIVTVFPMGKSDPKPPGEGGCE